MDLSKNLPKICVMSERSSWHVSKSRNCEGRMEMFLRGFDRIGMEFDMHVCVTTFDREIRREGGDKSEVKLHGCPPCNKEVASS